MSKHGHSGFSSNRMILDTRQDTWDELRQSADNKLAVSEGDIIGQLMATVQKKISKKGWGQFKDKYFWHAIENVTKDVIQKTTKLYKQPATRAFQAPAKEAEEGAEQEDIFEADEVFADILDSKLDFNYDLEMDRAVKMALITGGGFIRPYVVMPDLDILRFQHITIPQTTAVAVDDFENLTGIEYLISVPENQSVTPEHAEDDLIRYFIWDISKDGAFMSARTGGRVREPGFVEVDSEGRPVTQQEDSTDPVVSRVGSDYPYKDDSGALFLPIIPVRIDAPVGRLFNASQGDDLHWGTILASWYSVQMEWLIRNQSHKQFVLTGQNVDTLHDQVLDPSAPVLLPFGSADEFNIQLFDLRTDPAHIKAGIDDIYERLGTRRGVSLESFKQTAQRQTAEAQRIQRAGENDFQLDLGKWVRPVEIAFMLAARIVWNQHNNDGISTDTKPVVDFADPYESDPWQNWQEQMDAVSKGITSVVDIIMDHNKDLPSRDAALAVLDRNRRENRTSRFGGGVRESTEVAAATAGLPNTAPTPELESEQLTQEIV